MLEMVRIRCPYCGEALSLGVDASAGDQTYVEDCQVCCQPIALDISVSDAGIEAIARTGDET